MAFLASVSQFLGKTFALWVLVFAGLAYISPDSFKEPLHKKWVICYN